MDHTHTPMQSWPALAQYGRYYQAKGGSIFYYDTSAAPPETNSSRPALICIHGLGDEADSFRHIIPLLAQSGYRTIAVDLPGFGRSTGNSPAPYDTSVPWKGRNTMNSQTRALISLLEKTGAASAGNPAVVIGSSMGGTIAQIIAARRPDLVRALILIDGCYPLLTGRDASGFLLTALPFFGKKWYRKFRKNHESARRSLYGYYHDLDAINEEDRKFLWRRVIDRVESKCQEKAYFSSLRSMIGFNLFGHLRYSRRMKNYAGKILLVWGEADGVIPFGRTSDFRILHPNAAYRLIPNAGHLPHQEVPAETADAIITWLKNLRFTDV